MIRASLLLVFAVSGGVAEAADPQIKSVSFQRCISKAECSDIVRWSESPHASRSVDVRVVAKIVNATSDSDEFFLLTTTEYMIAPMYAYSVADFEKLRSGNEVSWGRLTSDDDMRSFVLRGLQRDTARAVTLRTLNLVKVLKTSFSEPDALWPWLVRVTARLVNREGQTISVESGVLELAPSAERTKAFNQSRAQH
jgi:hypothetical protein